jgi:hypothetical protein
MSQGAKFAIALVFYFLAGIALFVAFHPNGLTNGDGTPVTNLGEVVQWYMNYLGNLGGKGGSSNDGSGSGGSGTSG